MVVCKYEATVLWLLPGRVPSIRWKMGPELKKVGLDALPPIGKVLIWFPGLAENLENPKGRVRWLKRGIRTGGAEDL